MTMGSKIVPDQAAAAYNAASCQTGAASANQQSVLARTGAGTRTATKLGHFSFINSLPIGLPIERGIVKCQADITFEAPARLNKLISDGVLDVSAMSSFGFLSQQGLAYIPDVSISCIGPVGSVLLFSKHSLEDLADPSRLVVISAQSASSASLLKILMLEQFGKLPQITTDVTPEIDVDGIDAVLVIGDRALEVDTAWSTRYLRIDMGDWWWRSYNLPMVFGLWAARMDWIEANPSAYATISDALRESKAVGLSTSFDAVLDEAEERTGLARSRLQQYYQAQLNFDLGQSHLEGLNLYQKLARKHGLLR